MIGLEHSMATGLSRDAVQAHFLQILSAMPNAGLIASFPLLP
jgi:hypothetical protein